MTFDEGHQGDIAFDLDVVTEVESITRGPQGPEANLWLLRRLNARLVAGDSISVPQINTHGRIDVGLQSPWHIVETTIEADLARAQLPEARYILNALDDFVPCAEVLISGSISWCFDGLVVQDQRIHGDDLAVTMKDVDG